MHWSMLFIPYFLVNISIQYHVTRAETFLLQTVRPSMHPEQLYGTFGR